MSQRVHAWGPQQWASQTWAARQWASQQWGPHVLPATHEMVALADASDRLRNMQRRLSLVPGSAASVPPYNPLPSVWTHAHVALVSRLGGERTKLKKSMMPPFAYNRLGSEAYPLTEPPLHQFFPGRNTRLIDRIPVVTLK